MAENTLTGILNELGFVSVMAFVVMVVSLLVAARTKLLKDLELLERLRESDLDPEGVYQENIIASFDLSLKLTYGWLRSLPIFSLDPV